MLITETKCTLKFIYSKITIMFCFNHNSNIPIKRNNMVIYKIFIANDVSLFKFSFNFEIIKRFNHVFRLYYFSALNSL